MDFRAQATAGAFERMVVRFGPARRPIESPWRWSIRPGPGHPRVHWDPGARRDLLPYGDPVGVGGRRLLQRPREVLLEDRVVGQDRLVDAADGAAR
ncbi:hypothetical protein [Streptomyces sp. NPDC005890]|uniref:hypothetical protein n=1 Tax=Streptomyces sp. NPDC005890 TaxID=3154568 RepID=UPI00340AE8D8